MASSHAFTFIDSADWEQRRAWSRERYAEKWRKPAPVPPQIEQESPEHNRQRFRSIQDGLATLRTKLQELQPDALILIGDDQDENFGLDNMPQLAVYTGNEVAAVDRFNGRRTRYACASTLASS